MSLSGPNVISLPRSDTSEVGGEADMPRQLDRRGSTRKRRRGSLRWHPSMVPSAPQIYSRDRITLNLGLVDIPRIEIRVAEKGRKMLLNSEKMRSAEYERT